MINLPSNITRVILLMEHQKKKTVDLNYKISRGYNIHCYILKPS